MKVSCHPLHWKEAKKDRGRKEEIKGKANFASVRAITGAERERERERETHTHTHWR